MASLLLSIRYRNHRGEERLRYITPLKLWFGSTEWHPEPQWLLRAYEERDGETVLRDFALLGFLGPQIQSLTPAPASTTSSSQEVCNGEQDVEESVVHQD